MDAAMPRTGPPPRQRAILPTTLIVLRLRNPVIKNVEKKTPYQKKKKKSKRQLGDKVSLGNLIHSTVSTDNTTVLYTFTG